MKVIRDFVSRLFGQPPAPTTPNWWRPTPRPAPRPRPTPTPPPPYEPTGLTSPRPAPRRPVDIGSLVTPDLVAQVRDAKRDSPKAEIDIETEIERLAARCDEARKFFGAGRRALAGAELNSQVRKVLERIESEPEGTRALLDKALALQVDVLVHLLNVPPVSAAYVLRDHSPKE